MSLARVTITIPAALLADADRRAEALERSRSWLLVEALRAYLATAADPSGAQSAPRAPRSPFLLHEPGTAYIAGLGPQRLAQLASDLELTPEERVRLAQQTAAAGTARRRPVQPDRVIAFDRLEDYFAWERHEDLMP
jgi:hypothetical protein